MLERLRLDYPASNLADLGARMQAACGLHVSRMTLSTELRALGYRQRRPKPFSTRSSVSSQEPASGTSTGPSRSRYTARDRERPAPRPGERKPYPSDLSGAEWAILEPLIPPARPGGHPRTVNMREIMNAIFYLARTGCQWRQLPHDLPPWRTVHDYYRRWRLTGDWERINRLLRERSRLRAGRKATPSAAVIDSQSAKTTEKGGLTVMMRESM